MTILINEIYIRNDINEPVIVNVADSRLTVGGQFHENKPKLFKIPYFNACVGYFGLAVTGHRYMAEFMDNFIRHNSSVKDLQEFSESLCDALNKEVDKSLLKKYGSGIHVCGWSRKAECPQLFFIRNINKMDGPFYSDFRDLYYFTEDFRARDAKNPKFQEMIRDPNKIAIQYYVNGDVRPFHAVWGSLSNFHQLMGTVGISKWSFKEDDLEKIARWKLSVITSYYKKIAKPETIGTPIKSFVLSSKKKKRA